MFLCLPLPFLTDSIANEFLCSIYLISPTLPVSSCHSASWTRKPRNIEDHRRTVEKPAARSAERVEETSRRVYSVVRSLYLLMTATGRENSPRSAVSRLSIPTSKTRQTKRSPSCCVYTLGGPSTLPKVWWKIHLNSKCTINPLHTIFWTYSCSSEQAPAATISTHKLITSS